MILRTRENLIRAIELQNIEFFLQEFLNQTNCEVIDYNFITTTYQINFENINNKNYYILKITSYIDQLEEVFDNLFTLFMNNGFSEKIKFKKFLNDISNYTNLLQENPYLYIGDLIPENY